MLLTCSLNLSDTHLASQTCHVTYPPKPPTTFLIMTDDFLKLTHGNYHAWAPWMTAKLQCLGVWCFCTGDESIAMEKPILMSLPANVNTSEKLMAQRNLSEATWYCNDACHWNNQAIGTIMTKIEPSKYSSLENKSAKEVWDALKA